MTNLKEQISDLLQLQKLDSEIYALKLEKDSAPEKLAQLDALFEEKKTALNTLEKASLDLQKQKKERELDIGSKEEEIKKLQGQLFKLKTNKEYQTMLQQIQGAKADISVIEDEILEIMEKVDAAKTETDKEKKTVAGRGKRT